MIQLRFKKTSKLTMFSFTYFYFPANNSPQKTEFSIIQTIHCVFDLRLMRCRNSQGLPLLLFTCLLFSYYYTCWHRTQYVSQVNLKTFMLTNVCMCVSVSVLYECVCEREGGGEVCVRMCVLCGWVFV